jgi:hypothetical protein
MKEVIMSSLEKEEGKISVTTTKWKQYLLNPLKSGLFGFAIFFTILLAVKLFSYTIGTYSFFAIEITDIELSSIGFVLLFLIKELENFKEDDV